MPGQGGVETLRRMKTRFPLQKILIFTMDESASMAHHTMKLGASGYLSKSMAPDLMVQAIHEAVSGGTPISKNTTERLKKQGGTDLPSMDFLPREFEIFIYLVTVVSG